MPRSSPPSVRFLHCFFSQCLEFPESVVRSKLHVSNAALIKETSVFYMYMQIHNMQERYCSAM